MSRTAKVPEDEAVESIVEQAWTLPYNYAVETTRQEAKVFEAMYKVNQEAAYEQGDCADDDAGLAATGHPVESCADAFIFCTEPSKYGSDARTNCPDTCGKCAIAIERMLLASTEAGALGPNAMGVASGTNGAFPGDGLGGGPGGNGGGGPPPGGMSGTACVDSTKIPPHMAQFGMSNCAAVDVASCGIPHPTTGAYFIAQMCPATCAEYSGCSEEDIERDTSSAMPPPARHTDGGGGGGGGHGGGGGGHGGGGGGGGGSSFGGGPTTGGNGGSPLTGGAPEAVGTLPGGPGGGGGGGPGGGGSSMQGEEITNDEVGSDFGESLGESSDAGESLASYQDSFSSDPQEHGSEGNQSGQNTQPHDQQQQQQQQSTNQEESQNAEHGDSSNGDGDTQEQQQQQTSGSHDGAQQAPSGGQDQGEAAEVDGGDGGDAATSAEGGDIQQQQSQDGAQQAPSGGQGEATEGGREQQGDATAGMGGGGGGGGRSRRSLSRRNEEDDGEGEAADNTGNNSSESVEDGETEDVDEEYVDEDEDDDSGSLFGVPSVELNPDKIVSASDDVPFFPILDPHYGVCYQFRPKPGTNREVKTVGLGPNTVNLNTQIDREQYLGHTAFEGTIVTIHGENDLAMQGGTTVFIPPEHTAYIAIQKNIVQRIPLPPWAKGYLSIEHDCDPSGSTKEVAVYESEFMYVAHKCGCLNYFKWDYVVNKDKVKQELQGVAEENCGINDDPESTIVSPDWQCIYTKEKAVDAEDNVDDLRTGAYCNTVCRQPFFSSFLPFFSFSRFSSWRYPFPGGTVSVVYTH